MNSSETGERPFVPHEMEWTPELTARFWDYYSSKNSKADTYFSNRRGDSLIDFARQMSVPLHTGLVLDYSCGPGFLLQKLVDHGIKCSGCDFSAESVDQANHLLENRTGFQGAKFVSGLPSPFEDGTFDVVFFVEVIEHLLDEHLAETLADLCRVVRPGGWVIITTPNDENLDAAKVICPESGCIFHPMQHVQSWTSQSLSATMSELGLETVFASPIFLAEKTWASWLKGKAMKWTRMKLPHLAYLGRKPDSLNSTAG